MYGRYDSSFRYGDGSERLLKAGHQVVGIDNLNDYYDVSLKQARLQRLQSPQFHFHKIDLADHSAIEALCADNKFDRVIHLTAQAGVSYSIDNPRAYAELLLQAGDLLETSAEMQPLFDLVGFRPEMSVKDGVKNFVEWYREFYKI